MKMTSRFFTVLLVSFGCAVLSVSVVCGSAGEKNGRQKDSQGRRRLGNNVQRTRFDPDLHNGLRTDVHESRADIIGSEIIGSEIIGSEIIGSENNKTLRQHRIRRFSSPERPTAAAQPLLPGTSPCHVTCVSIKQHPVCASDGRTYSTKCHMRRHNKCENERLRVVSKGRCPGETRCQEERRTAIHDLSLRPYNDLYIPECAQDGTFQQIQCHDATGYCWCVSVDGKPIPGSSVQGHNLTCSKQDKSNRNKANKSRRGVISQTCGMKIRSVFNHNLLRLFNEEFLRVPPSTSFSSVNVRDSGYTANASALSGRRVLEWKFSELDANSDGQLNRSEVESLRHMVVKLVNPRTCAQNFHNYCDLDNNKLIALKEWTDCLSGSLAPSNISIDSQPSADGSRSEYPTRRKYPSIKYRPVRGYPGQKVRPGQNPLTSPLKPVDRESAEGGEANGSGSSENPSASEGREKGKGGRGKQSPLISGTNPRPVSFLALINRKSPGKSNAGLHHRPTNAPPRTPTDARSSLSHRLPSDLQTQRDTRIPTDSRLQSEIPPSSGLRLNPGFRRQADDQVSTTETSVCVSERTRAYGLDRSDPAARIFIPECESNGMFRRAQCHNATGYCWCVDDSTGVPIPGTSTHNATPDCSEVKTRKMKGCPFVAKKRFLTDLLDHITQEMVERINNGTIVGAGEPDPDQTIEERAVRWKLRRMDTNRNNILEKSELKEFRDELNNGKKEDEEKHVRKCRRNFLNYCDEDGNASISMDEWIECIGLNEQSSILPENPKRKGPNPFSTMLKS